MHQLNEKDFTSSNRTDRHFLPSLRIQCCRPLRNRVVGGFCLINDNNMTNQFVLLLIFLKIVSGAGTVSFTVTILDNTINAVTNYTFLLTLSDTSSRNNMTFTFPPAVATSNNTMAYVTGSNTPIPFITNSSTSAMLNTATLSISSPLSIVFTNIVNPYSALTSVNAFTFASDTDATVSLSPFLSRSYVAGTLGSCSWGFNQCTEQSNSMLTISLATSSHMPTGAQTIVIGYPAVWANQNQKSLFYGSSAISCILSFNGSANVSSGVTCANTSTTLTVSFTLSSTLPGNSNITLYVFNVLSPPTANTPSNSVYTARTADSSGNSIDASVSACVVQPTCVTNFSNGVIVQSGLRVNSLVTSIQTNFNAFPTITFFVSDTVEVSYTTSSSLVNCSIFRVLRNSKVYDLTSNITGTTMSYSFSSGALPNRDYAFAISTYLECSSITAPESETPTTFTYKFKRNGQEYMRLSATLTAAAATFNASAFALTLLTYQMGTATAYTFAFTIGQGLSSAPQFVIALPSDVVIGTLTCRIGVAGATLSSTPCSAVSTILVVNYASALSVGAGSAVVIQVVGLTNPMQPQAYTFGLSTYYNSSASTSKVQTNSAAFTATYTVITSLPITLAPNSFTVYTTTPTTLTFTCPIPIPALSTFTITFPTEVTQLAATLHVMTVNGNASLIPANPTITTTTVVFTNSDPIAAASIVVITISIRSPSYVNTFSYVQFTVTKSGTTYMQSLSSMQIQVTTPSTMLATITPTNSLTGATTPYLITIALTVPHAASFLLQIDFPTDVQFVSTVTSCAGVCASLNAVSNTIKVNINNPSPNTITSTLSLTITSFTNPRTTGAGAVWTFSTFTSLLEPISVQTAFPTIVMTNILTGQLLSTDSYYRNNSNTVKMSLTLSNLLKSTDYLLFSMDRTTYNVNTAVNCSSIYGLCSVDIASTTNLLVIRVIPNSANILANPLPIQIEGLISGSSTGYLQTDYITVGSYTSTGGPIDQGLISYNIDCRDTLSLPNNCRTCDTSTGACNSCYTSIGYFLNGTTCVTNCGSATTYYSFGNSTSGQCVSCASPSTGCLTCVNETACLSCLTALYFLYPATQKCSLLCPTTAGYLIDNSSGIRTCVPCADSNCLVCTNQSYGSCTLCSNTSILVSGMCSSSCPSTSYYVLSGSCYACHVSCYSCTSSTNTSCTVCAVGYYNSSGVCTNSCPTGKAIIPSNGTCGCGSDCLTCDSANYVNCTACNNISLFVYAGQCLSACPTGSYLSGSSCLSCSSGCNNCTSSGCTACLTGYFSFSGSCYGECNLLGTQYDSSGTTCVLCPSGCDTCNSGSCSSCQSDFTLSAGACVETCKLTNSCAVSGNVVPLPGCIAVVVWVIVVLLVRHFSHQTYVPYSLIIVSSVAEFGLVLAVVAQSNSTTSARLLATTSTKTVVLGLLGLTIALNYIANALYICLFIKYLKPLIVKLQQIDKITHTATLVFGFITNYRFAMVAFSRMFPRPRVPVDMAKYLTPVHYLCFASLICSIFPIVACIVNLGQQTRLSTAYMLSLDLLIVIIFNDLITVWFISAKKDDSYFQQQIKKEYASEDINVTKENIQKDIKDDSQANIVHSLTHSDKISKESDQYDFGESYKKLRSKKARFNAPPDTVLIRADQDNQHPENSFSAGRAQKASDDRNIFAIENDFEPEPSKEDVNFEERITKRNPRHIQSRKRTPPNFSRATTGMQDHTDLPFKSIQLDEAKFQKEFTKKKEDLIREDVSEDMESDLQESLKMDSRISVNFDQRKHLPRPIRVSTNANLAFKKAAVNDLRKSSDGKTNPIKPRYAESQATNGEKVESGSEDLAAIIRLKVQESALRRSKQAVVSAQQELDEVSPSYYNIQNQRFHISNLDDTDQ